jgi:glycosyltransferase involved in cell wall biosynthesis
MLALDSIPDIARPKRGWPSALPRLGPAPVRGGYRIGMIAACPFPANHGTPDSIREMAEAVADLGHEVHIIAYHFGDDIPLRGVHLHRITPLTSEARVVVGPTLRRPLYDLQIAFKTLTVLREHRLQLLHAHSYESALAAALCRMLSGSAVPILYSGHNTMGDELPSYNFIRPRGLAVALARLLDAVVPRLGDRCLPHSRNLADFFQRMGLAGRAEPVLNFGIDVDWVRGGDGARVRKQYGLDAAPLILYTGVLDHFQRLDLLLEAMRTVSARQPQARLLIVRTIPDEEFKTLLMRRAQELGVHERVVFTAPQPLEAIPDFLAAADVAVVPRPNAPGFPIKLLNYMAASRPCVLFASSASSGIVHRQNALLVTPETAAALGAALVELLESSPLRARLGQNGRAFVQQHHDRRRTAQQLCAAYARLISSEG